MRALLRRQPKNIQGRIVYSRSVAKSRKKQKVQLKRLGGYLILNSKRSAALRSFHRFEKGTNCRAWLIKIMYHTLSKKRRSENRLRVVSDTEEQIAETVAFEPSTPENLTEQEILEALKRLPQQFQEVVSLRR